MTNGLISSELRRHSRRLFGCPQIHICTGNNQIIWILTRRYYSIIILPSLIPLPVILSVTLKNLRTHGIEGHSSVVLLLFVTPAGGANDVTFVID